MSWLLALALFLGGLIPTGFMPVMAQAADGSGGYITMVICTADGNHTVTMDADGNVVDPDDLPIEGQDAPEQGQRDHACAFAISSLALAPIDLGLTIAGPTPGDSAIKDKADRLATPAVIGLQARGPPRG